MSYVFSDQQDKLSSLLGDPDTDSSAQFPLAQRKKELNRGELNFAKDSLCITEFATGTVASKEISVPSDWLSTFVLTIADVVVTNDREISLSQWERYKDWAGADPFYYYWEFSGTRKIKLLGTVNGSTYNLYYFKKPTTELSSDSDTSLLPEEYREGPVFYAASELMTQIGKTDLADYYRNKYDFWVSVAKKDCEEKYIKLEIPQPDFGDQFVPQTDVQGQGYTGFL